MTKAVATTPRANMASDAVGSTKKDAALYPTSVSVEEKNIA